MADLEKAKKLNKIAWVLTVVVFGLLLSMGNPMFRIALPEGVDLGFLPAFHSSMNVLVAISLIFAIIFIKKKDVKNHQRSIYVAMFFSVLFLLSYVTYHFTSEPVKYGGEGAMRTVYFIFLITHIILAGLIFPFILFTFIRGYTGQVEKHRKMAKWVFPIWLYVAISGPICYLMLMPYY